EWGKEKNIAWRTALPGSGASSPIVLADRVYLTTQTEDLGLHVLALGRAHGEILLDRESGRGKLHANNLHNMATPTPVSNGDRICAMFGTGDLACLDRAGKILWQRNLVKEYGEYKYNHGYGSSPMLDAGRLFITCMHQGPSYLVAIEPATGKNIWKVDRTFEPVDEARDSYSSPLFLRKDGRTQVILQGAETINAYNPASGEQLWKSGGLKVPHNFGRTISGPNAGEGVF